MSVAPPSRFLQFNKATVQDKLQDDEKLSKLTDFLEQRNAQVLKLKRSGEKQLPNQLVQERKQKCVALPVDSHDRGLTVQYASAVRKMHKNYDETTCMGKLHF